MMYMTACSGKLRVELVNSGGSALVIEIEREKAVRIPSGETGGFFYIPAAARGLTLRGDSICRKYDLPMEFASTHDREFVRPEGVIGRVARMRPATDGMLQLLDPEENSTTVNERQPVGFPVGPTNCALSPH